MGLVKAIAVDGQQHGSTYWNGNAPSALENLVTDKPIADQLAHALASPSARIWMTGSSAPERERMTNEIGDVASYVEIAGSQPFERYTGTVMADTQARQPLVLERTAGVRLVEQIPGMIMTQRFDMPIGWGGACGTAIWNYTDKTWSPELIASALGDSEYERILPEIVSPGTPATVGEWFAAISGISRDCPVYEPTGDNPASRVTIKESGMGTPSVISVGTSITVNIGLEQETVDTTGVLALMYDYVGRPFFLACKLAG